MGRRPFTAAGDGLGSVTVRPGTALGGLFGPGVSSASMAGNNSGGGGGAGYINVLGRDYRDLFATGEGKAELIAKMTSLQTIHTVTRLCSASGSESTPVVIAMKPVFMRASLGPKQPVRKPGMYL